MEQYLDFIFTEMATIVFKLIRLLPGALSSFQIIEVVIFILDAVFYPNTISAAWKKAESAPLNTVHLIPTLNSSPDIHKFLEQKSRLQVIDVNPVTFNSTISVSLQKFGLVCVGAFRKNCSQSCSGGLQSLQRILGVPLIHHPVNVSYCSSH